MATFLVKRTGPAHVTLIIPTDKGRATVTIPVEKHGAGRRVSVPDEHVDGIDPKHAKHLVRLDEPSSPGLGAEERPTSPATPDSIARVIKVEA